MSAFFFKQFHRESYLETKHKVVQKQVYHLIKLEFASFDCNPNTGKKNGEKKNMIRW